MQPELQIFLTVVEKHNFPLKIENDKVPSILAINLKNNIPVLSHKNPTMTSNEWEKIHF